MASQSYDKRQIFSEINITPLTDIFLVLLIIMMVIAPMFQSVDKNINMPKINNGTTVEDKQVTVAITKESKFFLNGSSITPNELESKLGGLVSTAKDKDVVVQADTNTKNKEIMKVIQAAQAVGFEKLTVAGQPLTQKQEDKLYNDNNNN